MYDPSKSIQESNEQHVIKQSKSDANLFKIPTSDLLGRCKSLISKV